MEFLYEPTDYYKTVRNLDIPSQWKKYTGWYLSRMRDIPVDKAEAFLDWGIRTGKIDFNDPIMKIFRRDDMSDRFKDTCTLTEFLKEVEERNLIMAPTLTCYAPTEEQVSEVSGYTEVKYYERARTKKESQIAKSYGRMDEAVTKNNKQNKLKEDINSISGLLTIGSTPLANRSGHSTLTSVCRTATAFTNASTERFFMGRRHFYSGPIVLENIVTVLAEVDYDEAKRLIDKYNLHYITVDELFEMVKYNTDTYYKSQYWDKKIYEFTEKLTDLERTIYLYMGDLFHLKKYNDSFVRGMFDKILAFKDKEPLSFEETQAELKLIDEFYEPLVTITVSHYLDGKGIKDKTHEDKDYYGYIGAYARHMRNALYEYSDYFKFFMVNKFIPAETALFPSVIRKSVLGGDTDSVLYTVMQWVEWYSGTIVVNSETKLPGCLCVYLINVITRHILAMAAGQMGVAKKYIHNLKMKSEYYFDVFMPTNRTKHYLSIASIQEGMALKHLEEELKGVALKNSKAPPELIKLFHDEAVGIMESISRGEKVHVNQLFDKIAQEEANIFHSIMRGDSRFLTSCTVKAKEAYVNPMSSEYFYYELWQHVFADKYGECPAPPFVGVRIKMNLPNRTALDLWLNNIKDENIRKKYIDFMEMHDKKSVASVILPADVVANIGIPEEFRPALNTRKMIFSCLEPFYILLEVFGEYRVNRWLTSMVLDERPDLIEPQFLADWRADKDDTLDAIRRSTKGQGEEYESWDKKFYIEEEQSDDSEDVENDSDE